MDILYLHAHAQLVMANPFDACEALIGDYSGKVVLFNETSECGLGVSGQNINNTDALAGAEKCFYYNDHLLECTSLYPGMVG